MTSVFHGPLHGALPRERRRPLVVTPGKCHKGPLYVTIGAVSMAQPVNEQCHEQRHKLEHVFQRVEPKNKLKFSTV